MESSFRSRMIGSTLIGSTLVALALSVAFLPTACGGGDGGGGGGSDFSTSLPGTKGLNTLTTTEGTTLCADVGKFVNQSGFKADSCKLAGFAFAAFAAIGDNPTDSDVRDACTAGAMLCTSAPADNQCTPPDATCTATVAELTACLNETKAALHAAAGEVPACSSLSVATFATDGGTGGEDVDGGTTGAACATFDMKCPNSGITDSGATAARTAAALRAKRR